MKKFLSTLVLAAVLASTTAFPTMAKMNPNHENQPYLHTSAIPKVATQYAQSKCMDFLNMAQKDGSSKSDLSKYYLGKGFNAYEIKGNKLLNTNQYYFPVMNSDKVEYILTVNVDSNNSCTATMAKSFADKVSMLENDGDPNDAYTVITADKKLVAVNQDHKVILESLPEASANDKIDTEAIVKTLKDNSVVDVAEKDEAMNIHKNGDNTLKGSAFINKAGSDSSRTLGVPGITQGNHPWCWAASIASIVDYKQGKSLSAASVVNSLNLNSTNDQGTHTNITNAWRLYGYSGTFYGAFEDNQVINYINANTPIQMLSVASIGGHSTVIDGYGISVSQGVTYRMMEPNSGSYIYSSTGQSATNTYYTMAGYNFYWRESCLPR